MPRALWRMPLVALAERWTPPGRARVLEPMVMDEPDSVAQFHAGGRTSSGMRAVHDVSARCLDALLPAGGRLLDLGCGSGRALAYLALRRPDIAAVGVDLADNMLARARELLRDEGLLDRIDLVRADIGALPTELARRRWDAVSCVWTLHHLPDEAVLAAVFRQMASLRAATGCAVWILDFQRLHGADSFARGLGILEPEIDDRLGQDATASEAAAFTFEELRAAARSAGLASLRGGRAWPIPWQQAHWLPGTAPASHPTGAWRELPLEGAARIDAMLLRRGFGGLPI